MHLKDLLEFIHKFVLLIDFGVTAREISKVRYHDNNSIKLLTRLRLNFSHLNEHQLIHSFPNTVNPMSSDCEPKAWSHFLLRCQNHAISRSKLLTNVCNLAQTLRSFDDGHLIHTLLYSSKKWNFNLNKEIIKVTVCYLKDSQRFDESLIWNIDWFLFVFMVIIIIILFHRDFDFWHIFTLTL